MGMIRHRVLKLPENTITLWGRVGEGGGGGGAELGSAINNTDYY